MSANYQSSLFKIRRDAKSSDGFGC